MTTPRQQTQTSATSPAHTALADTVSLEAPLHDSQGQIAALETENAGLQLQLKMLQDRNYELVQEYSGLWRKVRGDVGELTDGVEGLRRNLRTLGIETVWHDDKGGDSRKMSRRREDSMHIMAEFQCLRRDNAALMEENEVLKKWKVGKDSGTRNQQQQMVTWSFLYNLETEFRGELATLRRRCADLERAGSKDANSGLQKSSQSHPTTPNRDSCTLETNIPIIDTIKSSRVALETADAKLKSVLEQMRMHHQYARVDPFPDFEQPTSDIEELLERTSNIAIRMEDGNTQSISSDSSGLGGNGLEMSLGGETLSEFTDRTRSETSTEVNGNDLGWEFM